MRILVTGGAGFVGHHFVKYVCENKEDWEVVTLDRLDYSGNLNRLHHAIEPDRCLNLPQIVWHDLKAAINPQVAGKIGEIDYIIHMAAGSHVDRSIETPMDFVMDNVVGTANLLDYARTLPHLRGFLYFSTDEVYGPAFFGESFTEESRYNATNPYAATKAGAEQLVNAYGNTYRMPVKITNTMNVFGPRQHPEKFIPSTILKVLRGETVHIHSNRRKDTAGSRFYIAATDVASAVCHIIDNWAPPYEDWYKRLNIVGKTELDNLYLAQLIAGACGKPLHYEMVDFHSSRPGHDLRYALDGKRMSNFGWEPSDTMIELNKTIGWYLNNQEWLV